MLITRKIWNERWVTYLSEFVRNGSVDSVAVQEMLLDDRHNGYSRLCSLFVGWQVSTTWWPSPRGGIADVVRQISPQVFTSIVLDDAEVSPTELRAWCRNADGEVYVTTLHAWQRWGHPQMDGEGNRPWRPGIRVYCQSVETCALLRLAFC